MIFIVLIKGVPSKTATVVTTRNLFGGGVLDRQSMEIVINPYDKHTITAGDYLKRRIKPDSWVSMTGQGLSGQLLKKLEQFSEVGPLVIAGALFDGSAR